MPIIAFEGIDGAGKSTQIRQLSIWLKNRGHDSLVTCEPTHQGYGKRIREANPRLSPLEEREAFVLDRREHVETVILPALRSGKVVLCDRYYYSSMAYQGTRLSSYYGFFDEAAIDGMFEEIRKENEAFAPCADMLIIFDMSVEEALKRISQNRVCVDSFETRENLMQVRASFSRVERLIRATGKTDVVTVDASGDEATVSARLQSIVLDGFGRRGVVL